MFVYCQEEVVVMRFRSRGGLIYNPWDKSLSGMNCQ